MGLIAYVVSLFSGLSSFYGLLRDFFGALPLPVQILLYFAFGGFLLFVLLRMLATRG